MRRCSLLSQEPAWTRPRVLKFKLESCSVLTSCSVLSVAPRPHHPCRSGSLPDEYWQDSPTFSVNQDPFALARGAREKIYSQSRGVALTHTHTHTHTLYRYRADVDGVGSKAKLAEQSFLWQTPRYERDIISTLHSSCSWSFAAHCFWSQHLHLSQRIPASSLPSSPTTSVQPVGLALALYYLKSRPSWSSRNFAPSLHSIFSLQAQWCL